MLSGEAAVTFQITYSGRNGYWDRNLGQAQMQRRDLHSIVRGLSFVGQIPRRRCARLGMTFGAASGANGNRQGAINRTDHLEAFQMVRCIAPYVIDILCGLFSYFPIFPLTKINNLCYLYSKRYYLSC